jgi:hypothetical protein
MSSAGGKAAPRPTQSTTGGGCDWGARAQPLYLIRRTAMDSTSFSARYTAATAECGGRRPIEAGVLGRLAITNADTAGCPSTPPPPAGAGLRKAPRRSRLLVGARARVPSSGRVIQLHLVVLGARLWVIDLDTGARAIEQVPVTATFYPDSTSLRPNSRRRW